MMPRYVSVLTILLGLRRSTFMCLAITSAFVPGSAAAAAFITGHYAWALGLFLIFCVWSFITGLVYSDKANDAGQPAYELELTPAIPCTTPSIDRGTRLLVSISGTVSFRDTRTNQYADACYTWSWNTNPGAYTRHTWLHFDDDDTPPTHFRGERHFNRYDFYYEGHGRPLVIRLNLPHNAQHPQSSLTVSITPLPAEDEALLNRAAAAKAQEEKDERRRQHEAAEAERRRQQEAAEAKRREKAEALKAQHYDRFRTIQARYGDQLFAWRNDDTALARYAKDHRYELLNASRQQKIIDDYTTFTNDNLDFTEWLRVTHSELYYRVDEVFYYRVHAIAESAPKEYTPRRPKLTPEERQAKFERNRHRTLERERVQAEDRMAAVRQKLDLLRQFQHDLASHDLDDDDRERLIKEFEDDLFSQTEGDADGTFKQV